VVLVSLKTSFNSSVETGSGEFVNSPSKKKKRMSKRDNNSGKIVQANTDETLLNLVQENQELRGQLYRLKLIEYPSFKADAKLSFSLSSRYSINFSL
jgi:hypothetical protein